MVETLLPVCTSNAAVVPDIEVGGLHSLAYVGSTADASAQGTPAKCNVNVNTSGFTLFTPGVLTYYILPTGLAVTPGQILSVIVTISFS